MQKQVDAVAIGVIVFGVIVMAILFFLSNNNLPQPLSPPAQVNTTPIVKPTINVNSGAGDQSGGGGMSGFGGGAPGAPTLQGYGKSGGAL